MPDPDAILGRVFLVGAGPGDPGLITLRAVECLAAADVVLYDYLVNPRVLDHAPAAAERVCLGRHGQGRIWSQDEINVRLVELARGGKTVVRLKGGDPAIFARGADEAEALAAAGVPFEIVPGVTAALAAGSYAGIPITHRQLASAVALVTGQQQHDEPAADLDHAALAVFPGTLVYYMGVTTAPRWTARLIEAGKPADTPAAIVRRCSFADQQVVRCTLGSVAEQLAALRMRPPVIVIVGAVAALGEEFDWFTRRPLFGRRVLVTRPASQAQGMVRQLSALGADVLLQPAIEIGPPDDWAPVDAALARLDQFDWLVFSSANGVRYLLDRLLRGGGDLRRLGGVKLAVIGPGTADELARHHLHADLKPEEYRAESLAAALADQASGRRFLLARASRGRELLAEELAAAGAVVEQVVVYHSRDVRRADESVAELMASGGIHWTTVTSSAIAESLANLFGDALRSTRLASISPVTSDTLRRLGFEPAVEAAEYTTQGVVRSILTKGK